MPTCFSFFRLFSLVQTRLQQTEVHSSDGFDFSFVFLNRFASYRRHYELASVYSASTAIYTSLADEPCQSVTTSFFPLFRVRSIAIDHKTVSHITSGVGQTARSRPTASPIYHVDSGLYAGRNDGDYASTSTTYLPTAHYTDARSMYVSSCGQVTPSVSPLSDGSDTYYSIHSDSSQFEQTGLVTCASDLHFGIAYAYSGRSALQACSSSIDHYDFQQISDSADTT